VQDGHELRRVAELPAQLSRTLVTGLDLRRRIAAHGHVGGAERQAELQLQAGPLRARGEAGEQVDAGRQVRDRLGVGRGEERPLAGPQPARHRLGTHAGLGVVVREELGRGLDRSREVLGQRLRDLPVILQPRRPQQGRIGRVLDQGMLEGVGHATRLVFDEEQSGVDQLGQVVPQRPRVHARGRLCHRRQQLMRELPADGRPELRDTLGGGQPVETCGQQVRERRRDGQRRRVS
jgi:hypothetical protein